MKTLHHPALRTSLRAPLHRLVRQMADHRKRREPAWDQLTPEEQQARLRDRP